jgi:hypothetical protein
LAGDIPALNSQRDVKQINAALADPKMRPHK